MREGLKKAALAGISLWKKVASHQFGVLPKEKDRVLEKMWSFVLKSGINRAIILTRVLNALPFGNSIFPEEAFCDRSCTRHGARTAAERPWSCRIVRR